MGTIIFGILGIVALWAVFIRNDGALLMQFVDAVAPWLTERMLDNAGQ